MAKSDLISAWDQNKVQPFDLLFRLIIAWLLQPFQPHPSTPTLAPVLQPRQTICSLNILCTLILLLFYLMFLPLGSLPKPHNLG